MADLIFDEAIRDYRAASCSNGDQFWDTDQIVGDEAEQEVGGDTTDAAMLGLSHGAVLLAPAEDALDHRAARLRHCIAHVADRSSVDGASAFLADLGERLVLRDMRRDVDLAQLRNMVGGVIGLVFARRDAATCLFAFGGKHRFRDPPFRRSAVPVAWLTIPATARP